MRLSGQPKLVVAAGNKGPAPGKFLRRDDDEGHITKTGAIYINSRIWHYDEQKQYVQTDR